VNVIVLKLSDRHSLLRIREQNRSEGKTVVWTNGCFDLLHPGHVASLQAAKALGDVLIVGLNSDASVKANKGPTRPVLAEQDRATMLSSLACVDHVVIFDEPTPEQILQELKPDIHTKGMEYAPPNGRPVPEAATVIANGGRIEYLPLIPGISTTELIRRIAVANAAGAI
jgi:D-beta-D-heptose 7-phosphate kinase/D-beta-D-heptose 1-phosphate adenosyltransferase